MNIFLHELKAYRKQLLIWLVSMLLLSGFFFSILPGFEGNAEIINKLFSSFPKAVLDMFNLTAASLASLDGFYPMIVTYILLLGAIQAMYLGLSILSKETTTKVADFIFTKPVSRARLLTAKLFALLTQLLVTSLGYTCFALLLSASLSTLPYDKTAFFMLTVSLFFIQLICASLGVAVGAVKQRIKSVSSYALSIVFAFFIINMLGNALEVPEMRYFSPFSYFEASYIIAHHAYETRFLVLGAVIAVVSTAFAYLVYTKRDIHSA